MTRMFYARRTAGGRVCSFKGKSTTMNRTSSTTSNAPPQHSIRDQMTSTAVIHNPNIPSNDQIRASKPQMDHLAQKLSSIKVKKQRNISFNL